MEPTLRYLVMLSLLPREPQRTTAHHVHRKLVGRGFDVDLRSVQRDLMRATELYPVVVFTDSRPYHWSWARDAPPLSGGGIDPVLALTLVLADTSFAWALPTPFREALAPLVRAAHGVLTERADGAPAQLARRFRALPKGPPVVAPEVAPSVLEAVTRAVAHRRRLLARYRPQGRPAADYRLDPLALVSRGPMVYLVACREGRAFPQRFLLHRFVDAATLDESAAPDDDFDLDAFLAQGGLGFVVGDGEGVTLVARFFGSAAQAIAEAPLAKDQHLERLAEDEVRVRARVNDTRELRGWLLGFGDAVVVDEPLTMRDAMAATARAMAARYATAP